MHFSYSKKKHVYVMQVARCVHIVVVFHEFTIDYKSYDMAIYLAC